PLINSGAANGSTGQIIEQKQVSFANGIARIEDGGVIRLVSDVFDRRAYTIWCRVKLEPEMLEQFSDSGSSYIAKLGPVEISLFTKGVKKVVGEFRLS